VRFSVQAERSAMEVLILYEGEQISVPKEVADFLESDRKRMEAQVRQDKRHLSKSSFEKALNSCQPTEIHDIEDIALENLSLQNLRVEFSKLSGDEKKLLIRRFHDDKTLEEIGEEFEVSKMAISKRLKKLISRLRDSVE
jgi:RNA polymerase sigma factor (sigma-70 family)